MTEELYALQVAWHGAYRSPQAHPGDAAGWHDLLDRTRPRLREWDTRGCTAGQHRDDVPLPIDPTIRAAREGSPDRVGPDGIMDIDPSGAIP